MLRKYKLFPFYEKYEAKEFEEAQKYLKERVM